MLLTNQRLDKLAAARADFQERGMLRVPLVQTVEEALNPTVQHEDPVDDTVPFTANEDVDAMGNEGDSSEDSDEEEEAEVADAVSSVAVLSKNPCEFPTSSHVCGFLCSHDRPQVSQNPHRDW